MTILNEEFNFTYEMPEGYEEIKREDYAKYSIDPSTIFVVMNRENGSSVSLNRDIDVDDQKGFEDVMDLNVVNMRKVGMEIEGYAPTNLKSPSEYGVYSAKAVFRGRTFAIYFLVIRDMATAISMEIKEEGDKAMIEAIIESLKVLAD